MWSIFWDGSKFIRYSRPTKAFIQYLNHRVDLLSGKKLEVSFSSFLEDLESEKISDKKENKVIHLYYDASYILNDLEFVDDSLALAIEVEYSSSDQWSVLDSVPSLGLRPVRGVSKSQYTNDFNEGVYHLKRGDCYQFNLSYEFEYEMENSLSAQEICSRLWREKESISPYAHATFISKTNELILSNSPECLFQSIVKSDSIDIWTMPIKGTMPLGRDWRESFKKLTSSKKDRGELDMITDLLRNDITRIENQITNVVKRSSPLIVPKIIHQYSLIASKLSLDVNLLKLIKAVFPGGSITGAPKRRVIEILEKIENRARGIYCGSTILFNGDKLSASINIRTAKVDLEKNRLFYSAGGGITLLSKCEDEFLEMHLKKDSFIKNL